MLGSTWINMDQDQDRVQSIPSHQDVDILEMSRSSDDLFSIHEWHFLLLRREDPDNFVYTRGERSLLFSMKREVALRLGTSCL